jgi:hypothetical protein
VSDRVKRRRNVEIAPADDLGVGGKPRLWGIGPARIAELSGASLDAVHKAIQRGTLDPGCPWSLSAWLADQAGDTELAARLRASGHVGG